MIHHAKSLAALALTSLTLVACVSAPAPTSPSPVAIPTATPRPALLTLPPLPPPARDPGPTLGPAIGDCEPADLAAVATSWSGASGSWSVHVELTSSHVCLLDALAHPQLIDGGDAVLIDGAAPVSSEALLIGAGDPVKTLVLASGYCGPWPPKAPVRVSFITREGGRIVADASARPDMTRPPCKGQPGSPGSITMTPWTP